MTKDRGPAARPTKRKGGRRRTDVADRAAAVSHEIRGPLGAVATLVETLLSTGLDAEQRRLVELVQLANAHVLGLAEDLVADASLAAERFRVAPADFSPAGPVEAVAALWRPLLERTGPTLSVTIGDGLPSSLVSDAGRIRQILFNLLSNAAKAPGVGAIGMEVRTAGEPATLSYLVIDDGAGLPAGFSPEPFAADVHEVDAAGAGLGLWICGRIAEALSGRLSFAPRPGGGTVARLDLPLDLGNRPAATHRSRRTGDAGTRQARASGAAKGRTGSTADDDAPRRSALVVDDSVVSRMLMTTVLSSFGLQVVTAATGEEAEREAANRRPDVVLLDWSLHRETGADVMARLRGLFGADLPPVLAVSATSAPILSPGVRAHVAKPFTPREMFTALEEVLADGALRETAG